MHHIKIAFYIFTSFFISQNVFAQHQSQDKQLAVASGLMYHEGNSNFILAEAVKDKLIPLNTAFTLVYEAEHFTLNGKPLPEPLKTKYETLMRDFNIAHHNTNAYLSIESDALTLKDLLDPKSQTRHPITAAEIDEKIKEGTKGKQ